MSQSPDELIRQYTDLSFDSILNCSWATLIAQAIMVIRIQEGLTIKDPVKAEKFSNSMGQIISVGLHQLIHFNKPTPLHHACDTAKQFLHAAGIAARDTEIEATYMVLKQRYDRLFSAVSSLKGNHGQLH